MTLLCHVNLLKPYFSRTTNVLTAVKPDAVLNPSSLGNLPLEPVCSTLNNTEFVSSAEFSYVTLPNSKVLTDLDTHLSYFKTSDCTDIFKIIEQNLGLFSSMLTRANVFYHDIDVGDASPIKQHPYRKNSLKR